MGSGQWAVGSGQWAVGRKRKRTTKVPFLDDLLNSLFCFLPTAHCLLPTAFLPMGPEGFTHVSKFILKLE